jgi:hypothetical protein
MRLAPVVALLATLSAPHSFAGFFDDELDDYQSAARDRSCCWNRIQSQAQADCRKLHSLSEQDWSLLTQIKIGQCKKEGFPEARCRDPDDRSVFPKISTPPDFAVRYSSLNIRIAAIRAARKECEAELQRKQCGEFSMREDMAEAECLKAGFPNERCVWAVVAGGRQADLECPVVEQ